MEWIDIETKLPPQKTEVLVARWDGRSKVRMYFIDMAYRLGKIYYNDYSDDITDNGKCGKITHWMPIPDEPPRPDSPTQD